MPINLENGESVYCQEPVKIRQKSGLYVKARELARKYSHQKSILDLGCSDLVASRILAEEGFSVIGLDLAEHALRKAKYNGNALLTQADIRNLPLSRNTAIDTVLGLDILEHLTRDEAVKVLLDIKTRFVGPTFIVSMPIISANFGTIREGCKMIAQRKRPTMGLFDRTHQILTGRGAHLQIFNQTGLNLIECDFTNCFDGTTSGWEEVDATKFGRRVIAAKKVLHDIPVGLLGNLGRRFSDALIAYQGIYVLQ